MRLVARVVLAQPYEIVAVSGGGGFDPRSRLTPDAGFQDRAESVQSRAFALPRPPARQVEAVGAHWGHERHDSPIAHRFASSRRLDHTDLSCGDRDGVDAEAHGKEGVNGSSPLEGFTSG